MLSARRSLGNMRATFATQQHAAMPSSSRSLVSAVLLSRSQFDKKTVKDLQRELAERGLSTRGKKTALVDRLLESVSRGTVGSAISSASASASSASSFSTSSKAGAASKREAIAVVETATSGDPIDPTDPDGDGKPLVTGEVPVFKPSPVTPDAPLPTAGESPEATGQVTASPGIVVDQSEVDRVEQAAEQAPGGTIDMPTTVFLPETGSEASQAAALIPRLPDDYRMPDDYNPEREPFTMHSSWLAVSSASDNAVMHHGQPNKPTDDPESRTTEPRPEFQPIPDTTFLEDLAAGLGIRLRSKARKAASVTEDKAAEAASTLEQMLDMKLPKLSAPIAPPPKFEFQDRPFNQDERNGAYVLAGILGGGLLLGGLGKKSAKKEENDEHKEEKKTKH